MVFLRNKTIFMKKLIFCFYFSFISISLSYGQHYLNVDYSNPYFEIFESDDKTMHIHMEIESSGSFACDNFDFIWTKQNDGNYNFYLGEDGDKENMITVYANPLNDEGQPSKIVVKSNTGGFHPCDLKAATYVFSPIGD